MTVNTSTAQAQYAGNGTTQIFAIPFYFLVDTDIKISKLTAAGVGTVRTLNSDYTLTGAGNGAGGSATLVVAPASGDQILIERNVTAVQQTAYPSNSTFPAASHELALDRLTMLVQQLQTADGRTLTRNGLTPAYDAGGNTIGNVANAVAGTDLPNLAQVQTLVTSAASGIVPSLIVKFSDLIASAGSSLVGFIQAGAAAVSRLVQDKLREVVSVKDFGAKGDGTTDDTTAIANAFAYASGLTYPCRVLFPSGVYLVNSGFTVGANVSVTGQGRGTTRIKVNATNVTVFSCINATATQVNITIEKLQIQSAVAGTVGVKFTLCNMTAIHNMIFAGCAQNIVIDRGKVHQISDIVITGFGTNPMGSNRIWSSVDTDYVYNCNMQDVVYHNTATGANTASDPAMLYVRRGVSCYFHHFCADDLIDGTTGNPTFIMLENDSQGCKFSDMIGVYCYIGVVVQQGSGVAVVPNATEFDNVDIDQPTNTAISIIAAKYLTWNGGMITARGGFQGINPIVLGSGASYLIFNGLTVSGFNSGSAGVGFFFNGCTYVTIYNCVIDQAFNGVVFSSGNHIKLFGNTFTNCTNKYSGSYNTAGNFYAHNDGFNPLTVTGPGVPASGTPVTNTLGVRCTVTVYGGTVGIIFVNSVNTGLTSGSFDLAPGETIQINYSAAPSWAWIGH